MECWNGFCFRLFKSTFVRFIAKFAVENLRLDEWINKNMIHKFIKHNLIYIISALILCCPFRINAQKYKELGKAPAMEWNSWNKFRCDINEDMIKEMIDAMVSSGLRDAGYIYVNIDD